MPELNLAFDGCQKVGRVGAAGGILFNLLQVDLPHLVRPLKQYPVFPDLSGGAALGLPVTFFPLILFSCQHEIGHLLQAPAINVFWFLLFTSLAKFFVTSYLLASGWKGGSSCP